MNKTFWQILITLTFLLTACGQSTSAPQATPQPDQPTTTSSPLPSVTPTRTALPSATPTASITPLPTIPTFTPTFDVLTIVTVTPAQAEKCPQSNPEAKLDTSAFQNYPENLDEDQIYKAILDYLNAGGSRQVANSELLHGATIEKDLTNDSVDEFIVEIARGFTIYSCINGTYQSILSWLGPGYVIIVDIKDMNRDNIPELIVGDQVCDGHCLDTYILEWNGQELINLIEWEISTLSNAEIADKNYDGVPELVMSGPFPSVGNMYGYIPIRGQKDIYSWNGNTFSRSYQEFSIPEYRFQAIQDGDREISYTSFDKALSLYHQVIFHDKLEWWSKERRDDEDKIFYDS